MKIKSFQKKEDINELLCELSEIENNFNKYSCNIEINDQNDEPIESIYFSNNKTSGTNRRFTIKFKLQIIDFVTGNERNVVAEI